MLYDWKKEKKKLILSWILATKMTFQLSLSLIVFVPRQIRDRPFIIIYLFSVDKKKVYIALDKKSLLKKSPTATEAKTTLSFHLDIYPWS